MKEGSAYVWLAAHVASSCYKWAQDEPYALSFSFYQHTNVPAWLEDSPASCSEYFSLPLDCTKAGHHHTAPETSCNVAEAGSSTPICGKSSSGAIHGIEG